MKNEINTKEDRNRDLYKLRSMIEFEYNKNNLSPNFPYNEIYGRLTKLFKVKDVAKYGMAIQSIAGGRLRNVVIEKHTVGRDLL